jgi:hypothetical protein
MDYSREPSAHWNSYRPTYSLPIREKRGRSACHATSSRDHGPTPPPDTYGHGASNPNMVPITPRYFSSNTSPDPRDNHEYENSSYAEHSTPRPPQLWDPALDDLMGRTTRAYDLVINYARDSDGGTRWSATDIARIHETGKYLHANIRALKAWQRCAAKDWDYFRIQDDEDVVREMCEVVQGLIDGTERKTGWEMGGKGNRVLGQGGAKQEDGDKDMQDVNGQENSKIGLPGTKRQRKADRHERTQKRSKVTKRRPSPRRAPRQQRQAREAESFQPNRRIAGRLGNHVMHY